MNNAGLNDMLHLLHHQLKKLPPEAVTAYSTITVLFSKFIVLPVKVSDDVAVI